MTKEEATLVLKLICGETASQCGESVWVLGEKYLIRTVTHYWTGRLVIVTPTELVLEDAAWIADTGRFSDALSKGELSEIEPVTHGRVIVARGALVDAELWKHDLPRSQK